MMEVSGLGALILLVLDVWAIVSVLQSPATTGKKVLWVLFILILPLIGFLVWLFAGPRGTRGTV
ncbi:PLD nuclease N-terminal domain-containing protein [Mangrovicoccus sp. HB161399]|uniref:PLD nuclease N-terminal domain-containing protein n=1 Tax=Mangrovicoccus sp. HB161399 TaxID=2720392 RepID=UPI001553FB9E|nr:PLD nuclease N-terminal domain-containing protein [Mangrovicoccus sp. HB161399]